MTDVVPIRVPVDFPQEFPGSSASAAEVADNLVRAADAMLAEIDRRRKSVADLSASAFEALAILDGADEPLAAHEIGERLLVSSASMTSLLDTLERRGLVERHRHPDDRRKVLIRLTDDARVVVDRMLPAVHAASTDACAQMSEADREQLIGLLTALRTQLAAVSSQPPVPAKPRRRPRG